MRIQFSLSCQKGCVIPINYQSEISDWIFSVLSSANPELADWVQQRGFDLSMRTYKLFSFSSLAIFPYEMDQTRQEFRLMGTQVKLGVSIYLDPRFEQHIVHLFRQKPLQLGMLDGRPAYFEVKHWQIMPRINYRETMQFKSVAPISLTPVEDAKPQNGFLVPDSELYDINFFTHLVRHFKAAFQYRSLAGLKLLDPSFPMEFRLLSQAKSRLIHMKSNPENISQLRGFLFEFEASMPIPLMEFAYEAGFGEYGHLGFGYTDFR
jgi:CRISPR-associated endoribonuclease Cas6